jgi:hypothetical protein
MWFNEQQAELQIQRERLRLRSTALRLQVAGQARVLVAPLALADQVRAVARWLGRHPEVPLLALGLLVFARPRGALRWAGRLWWGWGLWQRVRRWYSALEQR